MDDPDAFRFLGTRIKLARENGNHQLVDALLDLWIEHSTLATDWDAVQWGIDPKMWADPRDIAAFRRMGHPGTSRLKL